LASKPILVQKYGGSSVATVDKLRRIAHRAVELQQQGQPLVLVVSAMQGHTDRLLEMAREVSSDPSRRELDMILSVGERTTMALLSMAIAEAGGGAISLTGSQCGIITDTDHVRARIIEVRPTRVFEALEQEHVVIVAGFQGVSIEKEVTTLGRGGSDTTAVALAAALGAERCEIYSDVDGVWDADPRRVEEAERIDRLAAGEMLAMGLSGARVMAAEAVDYARRHGITIHARSAFDGGRGTVITGTPRPGTGRATAVTSDAELLVLRAWGPAHRLDALAAHCAKLGLAWRHLAREPEALTLVVSLRNVADPVALEADLLAAQGTELRMEVRRDLGVVTLVGDGIHEYDGLLLRIQQILHRLDLRPNAYWMSPFGLHLAVPGGEVDACEAALHKHLLAP
jgi:aspartate kinase